MDGDKIGKEWLLSVNLLHDGDLELVQEARKRLKEEEDVHRVQTRAQVVQQQEKEADEVVQQVHEDEPKVKEVEDIDFSEMDWLKEEEELRILV